MSTAKTKGTRKRVRLKKPEFQLNDQQQAIVSFVLNQSGSLNVIARAGCGKTFVLLYGIIKTIVEEALGDVALMAFNKAISLEFGDKLEKMAKKNKKFTDIRFVKSGTVHSFGFGLWRFIAERVKLDDKKVMNIVDQRAEDDFNFNSVWRQSSSPIIKAVSLAKKSAFGYVNDIEDVAAWKDLIEHHGVNDLAENHTVEQIIDAAIQVYKQSIRMNYDVIDFNDMILAPLIHGVSVKYPKDFVLIDEAQDTNTARRELALKIVNPNGGRIIAVGDDRQAIFGFTGSDADSMNLIKDRMGSAELPLSITYRCPKLVVAEANRLVPDLTAHETAPEGVVRRMSATVEVPVDKDDPSKGNKTEWWFQKEQPDVTAAVLCRNTAPLIETAYSMLRSEIGCRVEGREIGEGLITLAHRWKRIKTLGALVTKLEEYKHREMEKWKAKGRDERVQAIEDKCDTVKLICEKLTAEGKHDLQDFDNFVRELFGDTKPGEVPKVVTLCTIHRSKGREWDTVYFIYRDTTLPSAYAKKAWQIHQENNLEYVAITRSKNELVYVD